jgi:hypothetical protein
MAQLVELGGIVSGALGLGPGRQDLPLELTFSSWCWRHGRLIGRRKSAA